MSVFIVLLRGINVGGHNRIKMADLKQSFLSLGYSKVTSYLQSGNVIFATTNNKETSFLENQIQEQILKDFNLNISSIVLTKKALLNIYSNNPFLNDEKLEIQKLYIAFLNKNPDLKEFKSILEKEYSEEMIIQDRVIYLYYTYGYGKSKVNNNFFESKLNVAATTRNWKTIRAIKDILEQY